MEFLKFGSLSIVWGIVVTLLYLFPGSQLPNISYDFFIPLDKLIHGTMFFIWALLQLIAYKKQRQYKILRKRAVLIVIVFSFLYGLILEIAQSSIAVDRSTEVLDIVANTIGILIGVLMFRVIYGEKCYNLS